MWVVGIIAAVTLTLTGLSELALSAVSPKLTEEAARGYVLDCISEAVEAELQAEDGGFVAIQREAGGGVSLVSADSERLNSLRAKVLQRLSKDLRGRATVYIPVGSLTGVGLFNGRGFPVPVRMQLEGSAVVEFSTDLISAGVNQTCHRLSMKVSAQVFSQSKRFETSVQAETSTVLAETLVVGEVPKFITGQGAG